jgi:kinesin family protein 6/9
MGKSNVRVVVRARPTANFGANFQFNEATDSIDMGKPKDATHGMVNNQQESWHFKLDKVLRDATQEQVFNLCASDVVRSVMDGYNGTVMAYGQTGAGKTHTMTGGHVGFQDRGIVARSISLIYAEAAARPENMITVRLSYAEIYNELMFDLLTDVGVADQSGDMKIVEDARGNIQVRGLSCPVAATEEEALHIFFQGDTNRHVAEHALNKGSTRSHVVFTIHVESRSRVESQEKVIYSKLHLVDLAGSERVKKTGTDGVTLKEAAYINKSLSFLEQVVVALGDKHRDHVPYRQSKLTHMLKDSIGGNCKTTMIANVWPEAKMLEETASTLRFATRMMRVSNEASVNVHLDPHLLIKKYERQIKDLKQELAMHNTLANRSSVTYDDYSPDEQRELEDKVKMYLEGEQELEINSLRFAYEAFSIFRKLYQELKTELANRPTMGATGLAGSDQAAGDAPQEERGLEGREGEVGETEERGISVGLAPAASRPAREDRGMVGGDEGDSADGGVGDATRPVRAAAGDGETAPDKQVAFADWKSREGQAFEKAFEQNRTELKEKRSEMREAMAAANSTKKAIDDAKEALSRKQADRGDEGRDEELIDEEEYALIRTLKETKQKYRDAFEKHRAVKMDVIQIEHLMQQTKTKLVQAFEEWYDQKYGQLAAADMPQEGERYDPQEMFDMMQASQLSTQHPDALAYHTAKKNAARDLRQKKVGTMTTTARGGR